MLQKINNRKLRVVKLKQRYLKIQRQIKNGESWVETANEHIKRLQHELIVKI